MAKKAATNSNRNTTENTYSRKAAEFVAGAMKRRLDAKMLERAKLHSLDTFAAMISGADMIPGEAAIRYAKHFASPKGDAGIIASKLRTNAVTAALVNGMTAHADETDDSNQFSLTHPGCAVIPAALAMAEREKASGLEFLKSVAVGYDICAKMGMALGGQAFIRTGKDSHAVAGCMGAAAAAASLAGLNAARTAVTLSYASQSASGLATLFRDPEHVEKAFVFGGLPARGGIEAAMMVQSGMSGIANPLDGKPNFFTANNHQGDIAKSFATLGKPFEITRTNIKRWSVGSPAQAVMDALYALITKYNIKPGDIVKAEVFLSPGSAAVVDSRPMLDINVQYLSAVMLLDGTLSFAASHDFTRAKKPEVVNMLKKVTLLTDAKLGGEGQAKNPRQGAAAIYLKDGRRVYHHAKAVRGTAENPMTVEEVEAKAHDLIKPVLGAKTAGAILKAMAGLDKAKSVDKLVALMQGK